MAEKLLIVLMNTDPKQITEVSMSLFQATVAASMEFGVEMIFTGRSAELARAGVAAATRLQEDRSETVYDLLQEAHEAGVVFKVCAQASEPWEDELIPEIDEIIGSAYLISEAMSDGTVTFTY